MAVMSTLVYDFSKFIAMMVYKKTTPNLSIVKRLGGSGATKVRTFIEANKFLDAYNTI